ncbi:hypothetical protein [Alkalihalobacillus deserti]|uniref:hypothetical protein n=1 Tax=Alkalihalobacillus deserti TaxID=2879466 RepID=UPI001D137895|nr:hypothetical protein [Alkalihalobacillus deserti]
MSSSAPHSAIEKASSIAVYDDTPSTYVPAYQINLPNERFEKLQFLPLKMNAGKHRLQ